MLLSFFDRDVEMVDATQISLDEMEMLPELVVTPDVSWMDRAGMTEYKYLVTDGGPHVLLPSDTGGEWGGYRYNRAGGRDSDYNRALASVEFSQLGAMRVGEGL
ncbi:MAG: hypothetical protein ACYTGQ_17460, partial [Planctomycetota bacterium]